MGKLYSCKSDTCLEITQATILFFRFFISVKRIDICYKILLLIFAVISSYAWEVGQHISAPDHFSLHVDLIHSF